MINGALSLLDEDTPVIFNWLPYYMIFKSNDFVKSTYVKPLLLLEITITQLVNVELIITILDETIIFVIQNLVKSNIHLLVTK